MVYNSASDMFLDNRRGLEGEIKHLSEEDQEKVLNAYDWAVSKFLEIKASYDIFRDETDKRFGEGTSSCIEEMSVHRFMEIGEGARQYFKDVEAGKCVGYSAEE